MILSVALLGQSAFAESLIKVQAPNLVGAGEQFNVIFIVAGSDRPSDFQWSPGEDFQLVWGPTKGVSISTVIENGVRTKSSQTSYTYVLMPRRTGIFTLAAATAMLKGEELVSERPVIEVVSDGGAASSGAGGGEESGRSASQVGTISSDDIFMRLTLSKSNVMVGETITATLKLYQRVNVAGFDDARFPTFNGFWSQEVQAPSNIEFHRENIGDKIYNAAVLRSWSLVPQQAGDIRIDPAELVCLVNVRSRRQSSGSIFDSFFQDDYQTIRKRVATPAQTVRVSALPAGAPDSFGGGVGEFRMTAELTRDSLNAHDAASLKVTVTGTGNVSLLEAPRLNFPPDFEVYDVKTADVPRGKVFEFPFIPRSAGEFEIGPVRYSYFDIGSRRYVTLSSGPLPVSVAKGGESAVPSADGALVQGVVRKNVKVLGSDIRYINTDNPSLSGRGTFFAGSAAFTAICLLLVAAAVLFWFLCRSMERRRADVAGSRSRAATKMARKRLSVAENYLKEHLYTAFYEELHKALLGFVADRLGMDSSDMTKENIASRLEAEGASEALAGEFVSLIDACEFARYAPDAGHEAMNAHFGKAVSVISEIDDKMKISDKGRGRGAAAVIAALAVMLPYGSADAAGPGREYSDSLWTAGVEAYSAGDWTEAGEAWQRIESIGLESEQLYCNIGDAFYKSGDIARAVLYYERALKLNPSYSDARHNLEFVRAQVPDKIDEIPEFFLSAAGRKLCYALSSDTWAAIFIVLLAVCLAMLLLYLRGYGKAVRRTGFIMAIVSFALAAVCFSSAMYQKSSYFRNDAAVVVRAVAPAKSSPGADATARDLFILHEGTKVRLLDRVGDWFNVELADGRQGWMRASELEII